MITMHINKTKNCISEDMRGWDCAQIFTHGPKSLNRNNICVERVRSAVKRLYIHSSYLFSFDNLEHAQEQFDLANELGVIGVVLHLKKQPPNYFIESLNKINCGNAMAILEMKACKRGTRYGYQTPEEINELCEAIISVNSKNKICICLDTAHINAGQIKLNSIDDIGAYVKKLKYPELIRLLHLNGNAYDPQVKAGDKHVIPTHPGDYVFTTGDGDVAIAEWFLRRDCDVIVECKDAQMYIKDLKESVDELRNKKLTI